jgi:hypothetical protein
LYSPDEEFLREPLPHFNQVHYDPQGRLWVIGVDEAGQPFGDVFRDAMWLGRLEIPWPGSVLLTSSGGHFMAVLCSAPLRDEGVELQVYRLLDGGLAPPQH